MEDEVTSRPLQLHIFRWVPIVLILGLLIYFLLPRLDTIEDSLKTLRTLVPWAIAIAVLCETLSYIANGGVLQSVILLAGERLSIRRCVAIEMGAATVSIVAAGALGFGAAIYKWTRKSGLSTDTAMLASWLPSVFDSAALVVFALISAINLLFFHRLGGTTGIALAIVVSVLAALIALLILLLARNDWLMVIARRGAKLMKRFRPSSDETVLIDVVERAEKTWSSMRSGGWIRPACCSLMVLTFDLLCLRYSFLAVGEPLKLSLLLAGYGVPILLGRASFLPGGIAVIEVAMAALFGGLGVPANHAVVAVLTYRLISFWLPTLIGIPIAIALQSRRKR
jgi:uncharacterized protein (TIRG00374 family)